MTALEKCREWLHRPCAACGHPFWQHPAMVIPWAGRSRWALRLPCVSRNSHGLRCSCLNWPGVI